MADDTYSPYMRSILPDNPDIYEFRGGDIRLKRLKITVGMAAVLAGMFLAGCSDRQSQADLTLDQRFYENTDFLERCDSEIAQQVTDIMKETQKGRYDLENCMVYITEEGEEEGYIVRRMTFRADWQRIREPEDDPLIKGMVQAMEGLESDKEKEAAGKIIDGYLVEMDSEPNLETVETKFVVKISPENETVELFYPYVQEGQETLIPFREFTEENWMEDSGKRMEEGKAIIRETISGK